MFGQKDFHLKIIIKKTSDHISVLSDQNRDLVGHMSFQEEKLFAALVRVTNHLTITWSRSERVNDIMRDF